MTIDAIDQLKLQLGSSPWVPPVYKPVENMLPIRAGQAYKPILKGLLNGQIYYFEGTYGTAMGFYSWLKKHVNKEYPIHDYPSSRIHKNHLQQLGRQLLLRIRRHEAALSGAPQNGWLRLLFPDQDDFLLSLPAFLGMNGSWQWFTQGIRYPGLQTLVHPFYGTYFPTRTEHLELFNHWLSKQKPLENVLDMGTGCGVITQFLLQAGNNNISATDININCLYSLANDLQTHERKSAVQLIHASFFDDIESADYELVVFNPPWIPDAADNQLDKAIYHESSFFDDFFDRSFEALTTGSRLLMLFSTFSLAAGITDAHPIRKELEKGRFTLLNLIQSPVKQTLSKRKNWLSSIRHQEIVELWELKKN